MPARPALASVIAALTVTIKKELVVTKEALVLFSIWMVNPVEVTANVLLSTV